MKNNTSLVGRFAYLPGRQKVWVERIDKNWAVVRRVGGPWHRRKAVCDISSLELERSPPFSPSCGQLTNLGKQAKDRLITP